MPGLLDDDEDLNIDDLFEEPAVEHTDEEQEDIDEKKQAKEKWAQQERELKELKEQLNELKSQRVGSLTSQSVHPPKPDMPIPLKQRIKASMEQGMALEDIIASAAEEAAGYASQVAQSQYKPVIVQSARQQIARFLDDTPMISSVRKEFDKTIAETPDEVLASFDPKGLSYAIQKAYENAEGVVAIKTKSTRGNEPPVYSTGNNASFGRDSTAPAKHKLTQEEREARRAVAELAASMMGSDGKNAFSKKEVQEMIGDNE
jgi:hypothetical protein